MSAPLSLALRYLMPKRSFVSVITLISILGVLLGVAVMMVVMAVFKGWQIEYRKLIMGSEAHLSVFAPDAAMPWRDLSAMLAKDPAVAEVRPVAQGDALLRFAQGEAQPAVLMGLGEGDGPILQKLRRHLLSGDFDLGNDSIVLPDALARKLGVRVGDTLSLLASQSLRELVGQWRLAETQSDPQAARKARESLVVLPRELVVSGLLRADTAGQRAYLPLFVAQELFDLDDQISFLRVELKDPEQAEALAQAWASSPQWNANWQVQPWTTEAGFMLQSVENQQSMLYFLLLFIILVAAFCVMNTTITVTIQKRREIGILTALGCSPGQIMALFVTQAVIVSLLGIASGLAAGFAVLAMRHDLRRALNALTGRDFFPQDIYFLSEIPAHLQVSDLISIVGLALLLCSAAALLPAWSAARLDPARALRQ